MKFKSYEEVRDDFSGKIYFPEVYDFENYDIFCGDWDDLFDAIEKVATNNDYETLCKLRDDDCSEIWAVEFKQNVETKIAVGSDELISNQGFFVFTLNSVKGKRK